MNEHDCGSVLVPIPAHMDSVLAVVKALADDATDVEFGRDEQGRACFRIDGCIVDALKAVWAAGYKTLGCCCGHGQNAGGIITIDNGTFSLAPRTGTQERYAAIHATATAGRKPCSVCQGDHGVSTHEAVEAEREACAVLADAHPDETPSMAAATIGCCGPDLAKRIRARGEA